MKQRTKKKLETISNGFLSIFGLTNIEDYRILPTNRTIQDAYRRDLKNIGLDIYTVMIKFEEENFTNEQKDKKKEFETSTK